MYSMAAVAFIVVAGGGALYLSQRPTVAHGAVLAETVHDMQPYVGVSVTCDDAPITSDGADFACKGTDSDGSYEDIACSLKPNGSIACKTTDEHRKHRRP
jgi:hypothetical protein